jgi:glycosyltransferase involved in cell wall biosynthesis
VLAIVIPYYKLTFFEATLQSLANQTDKRFKVYIGNDASPENPTDLIENYWQFFDLEYKPFESNLGGISLVRQWERCMAMVNDEEWVMILGDDDTLSDNYVESFYQNIDKAKQYSCDVIRFATTVIDSNGKAISNIYTHPEIENSIDFLFRKLKGGTRSSLSEYVFRKNDTATIGFKDLPFAWHSDDLAVLEFSKFKNIYTINSTMVFVRLSNLNISGMRDNLKLKNIASFKFYHYLLVDKATLFSKVQRELIFFRFEKSFMNDKKNRYFWSQLIKTYFINGEFKRFFKLLMNAAKSVKFNN